MHALSGSADWQWTRSPRHCLFGALKTILGTWGIHAQACWPLKLWAQLKEWYVLSHSSKDVSGTLLTLMHWDYFSLRRRSIKHTNFFFGQNIAKEYSHCYVSTHCVRGTETCTLGVPAFSHNCSSFRTCRLHICPYLFEKIYNRSTVCCGATQV